MGSPSSFHRYNARGIKDLRNLQWSYFSKANANGHLPTILFRHLIFYAYLGLRLLELVTNTGPRRPVPAVCRILCSNVRGLARNLSDLTVTSSQYDILLCSETVVPDKRHVPELLVPDSVALSCYAGVKLPRARGMATYVRDGNGAFSQPKFQCGCYEIVVFRVCGVRQNLYVFSLYRNPR